MAAAGKQKARSNAGFFLYNIASCPAQPIPRTRWAPAPPRLNLEAVLEIETRAVKPRERHALEEIALTDGTTFFRRSQPRPPGAVSIGIAQFGQKMNFIDYYEAQGSRSRCTWIDALAWMGQSLVILPHDGAPGDRSLRRHTKAQSAKPALIVLAIPEQALARPLLELKQAAVPAALLPDRVKAFDNRAGASGTISDFSPCYGRRAADVQFFDVVGSRSKRRNCAG